VVVVVSRRRALGAAAWPLVDQGLYSASNLVLAVLVARQATLDEFGAFSLAYAVSVVVLGTTDGLIGEALAVTSGDREEAMARRSLASAAGAALLVGVVAALALGLVAAVAPGPVGPLFGAFALLQPALFLQSAWRFGAFTLRRPRTAVANDTVWVGVQVAALALVLATGHDSPPVLVLAWGSGAVVAAVYGAFQFALVPAVRGSLTWLRETAHLGGRFAAEFLGTFGASQLALALIGAIAGFAAIAQVRGAQVLFGPLNTLANGLRVAAVPVAVRLRARGGRHLDRFVVTVGVLFTAAVVVWTGLLLVVPDDAGRAIMGDSWLEARDTVPAMAANVVTTGFAAAFVVGLRGLADAKASLRGRLGAGGVKVAGAVIGAVLAGGIGGAWGLAAAGVIGTALLWRQYVEAKARSTTEPDPAPADVVPVPPVP
jgi:O-antigen/teichoic acid export membrane protein